MGDLDTTPYWDSTSSMTRRAALDRDITVDVVVIGAGVTGLTAAYLLKKAGRSVAVIDRGRAGGVDSGLTTAHVTCVTDLDLTVMARSFGRDHARAVWDAGMAAIDQIEAIVDGEGIECEWTRIPGYKHLPRGNHAASDVDRMKQEAALANELGFDATYLDAVPFMKTPGVEVADQAKFHPRQYLAALADRVDRGGSYVFEHTESGEISDSPLRVEANGHTIRCGHIVIATHTPLMGLTGMLSALALQTKLYLYTSYVVGGRLPEGTVPEASFWDTSDPYYYLRIDRHRGFDYAIFGGQDHKTGQVDDPRQCYDALEAKARVLLPQLQVTHHWSGQVVETNDGLPFIGETAPHQFAATGYAGNGMTFGTAAGMMARDYVLGTQNPWQELFDVGRTKIKGGAWDYLKENVDYPYYLMKKWLTGPQGTSLREIKKGEGKILELEGETVAAYRSERGRVTLLSPVCTHMGCRVEWNTTESTWDCPCHGSRFEPNGDVLAGPAESPLEKAKTQAPAK
jgi:glycine/D-amino acid oxidase-like deaminating enzyme/nitrite reductase/ring-hydroxylating ferredoxin subunit